MNEPQGKPVAATPASRCAARRRPRGFTLVEALAALLLVAIVLPVVMRGVTVASRAAASARRNTEAASLAQSKLNELVATEQWRSGYLSGRFESGDGDRANDYTWTAEAVQWREPYTRQLAVRVGWVSQGLDQQITLTTVVYEGRPKPETTAGEGGGGTDSGAGAGGGGTQ
jgi:prepilin-type N-terminal cleavage/methylation domain-containing protein